MRRTLLKVMTTRKSAPSTSPLREEGLWTAFKAGETWALEELYREYSNPLYNYGFKFNPDKEMIRDCVQELFVNLWERRQYLGNPAHIKNYLFKSFRLIVFKTNTLLQNREAYHDAENYPFFVSLSMEDEMMSEERDMQLKKRIGDTLNLLTARQREAIFLKFYENLSYDEIAEVMGLSVKGTYKLMARALEMLRKNLEKNDLLLLLLLFQVNLYH